MRKGTLIYAGGFRLPDGNASAQRAVPNAQLFRSLGYRVILVGKLADAPEGSETDHFEVDGIECYDIEKPDNDKKYTSYVKTSETIERVVQKVGAKNVVGIAAYNYPNGGLMGINKFARANNIVPIADTTEWYALDNWSPVGLQRFLNHEYRMRVLQKSIGNLICAGRFLEKFYHGLNTVIIPNCVDMHAPKWQTPAHRDDPELRRFVYAGSPGAGMKKEYMHWLIDSFLDVKAAGGKFKLVVVGLTQKQLLQAYPDYQTKVESLGDSVEFRGRVPHLQALAEIKSSDFFVFLRPDTRVNRAGCPTKLAEAFACGVPTITNASGDVEIYLAKPNHGFLFPEPDRGQLSRAITSALQVNDANLAAMKESCRVENPFRYEIYQEKTEAFFDQAR